MQSQRRNDSRLLVRGTIRILVDIDRSDAHLNNPKMNIVTAIQKHYRQETTLSIDNSIASVRSNFAKLAVTGITHGNRWNLLITGYKFKVQWDGQTAHLDGPYGLKMSRLVTKITLQPGTLRNATKINLMMQFSVKDIKISFISSILMVAFLCFCGTSKSLPTLCLILSFGAIGIYGCTWMYFIYSRNIILKCLVEELAAIPQDIHQQI